MSDSSTSTGAARRTLSGRRTRIAVIGGGITGLAAAHRLGELEPSVEVRLYERSQRLGGVLETQAEDGYLLEQSADNFITNLPGAVGLCRRLGFEGELLASKAEHRRAWVVRRGRLCAIPEGFTLLAPARWWPIATTRLLSPWGKLRLALERWVPPRREPGDESFAAFARRRLGREVFARLVQPLVSGIYTADPERLSMAAALPRFVELEGRYGSLTRGLAREAAQHPATSDSGARYSLFTAPRQGMESLVAALAERLPAGCARLGTSVERLERTVNGWRVYSAAGATTTSAAAEEFDGVIVAVPAPAAARLLESLDAKLAELLAGIPYAGCTVALVGYRREQLPRLPLGAGVVVPECEGREILSISFASQKYAERAPEGEVLLRVFVGGACHPELEQLPDEDLRAVVTRNLHELLGAQGPPRLWRVRRWQQTMPQYHVGHVERVAAIAAQVRHHPELALAGNAYRGVGVPQCIASGEEAAANLLAALRTGLGSPTLATSEAGQPPGPIGPA